VRLVASQGLEARERAGIKIRQPLATLSAKKVPTDAALRAIIAEEVNVKEVVEDTAQHADVVLDTNITPELKEEGMFREWVRSIQGWRKDQNFSITDRPAVRIVSKDADFLNHHAEALISATGLQSLEVVVGEETLFEKL
jgi:isoleucyl-tRNA synthetase